MHCFLCAAMLGEDISSWKTEDTQSSTGSNGILEAAAFLSSVIPASDASDTVIIKQEQGTEVFRCRYCLRLFYNQSDFAIHLRGHLIPSSLQSHSRGRPGRPWSKAGLLRPFGKRGPGRPRKAKTEETEGVGQIKTVNEPRRRGRPRKHPVMDSTITFEEEESGSIERKTNEKCRGMKNQISGSEGKEYEITCGPQDVHIEENPETNIAQNYDDQTVSKKDNVIEMQQASENDTISTVPCITRVEESHVIDSQDKILGLITEHRPEHTALHETENDHISVKRGRGRPRKVQISLAVSKGAIDQLQNDMEVVNQDDPDVSFIRPLPKRRGRPPKQVIEKGEINILPICLSISGNSLRRVQPRRILKGKRTSSFWYPGESDSEDDKEESEEERKVKGKNIIKQLIYSNLSNEESEDEEIEEGEVVVKTKGHTGLITVHSSDGIVLSETPVILVNKESSQALQTSETSISKDGIPEDQVIMLQTLEESAKENVIEANVTALIAADQNGQSTSVQQDALAALVDVALSSQKMDDFGDDGKVEMLPSETDLDETSDDPDWEGVREPTHKRRPKRRRGDDPELEELEEMVQVVEGIDGKKEFACGVCSKRFQQLKYLKMHLPAHTDKYRCHACGRRFARHESLLKHTCENWLSLVDQIPGEEEGSVIFRCCECGRTFPHRDHARRHASMHQGTWACEKCQRCFPRRQLLLDHTCAKVSVNLSLCQNVFFWKSIFIQFFISMTSSAF